MNNFKSKLNINEQILLNLIANNLFGAEREISIDKSSLKSVWAEAYVQTVPLIAFSNAEKYADGNELSVIKASLSERFAINTKIDFEHIRLHKLMSKAGIPYTVIKGLASAIYYKDPLMRAMGDVDFLINPDDIDKADKLLKDNGFELIKDNHSCHRVYTNNNCRYEMHFEPAGIPDGKSGTLLREFLSDAVSNAVEVKTELGNVFVPSPFHHGLIILLHMCHHMTGEGIGLRHLCDWAVFVSSLSESEFCPLFEEKLKKAGLWRFARIITQLCIEYLGCPEREWVGKSEKLLTYEIVSDIFAGGNFGQKNSDRGLERLLLSSKGEKESMISRLFITANSIVYSHWKISRKIKILLPLGWLFFGGRYLLRSLMKKRPEIRPSKIAAEATKRKKIYSQLNLFE